MSRQEMSWGIEQKIGLQRQVDAGVQRTLDAKGGR